MPVGAIIGGAVIGAGGAVASGAMGSSATKHAADTAAATSAADTAANNALIRETRDQNLAIAQPFYQNGLQAGNALSDLLLGSHYTAPTQPATGALTPSDSGGDSGGPPYSEDYFASIYHDGIKGNTEAARAANQAWYARHPNGALNGSDAGTTPTVPATPATPASDGSQPGALSAFDQFRNSTNYQWRYNQGLNATSSQYATKGALDSGAAEKAKITFGQNTASNELANYMNLLAGQQNVGLSAGNAVMGVSTNATNAITAQNTNAANAAGNAALAAGTANANMWGTVGSAAGQVGGALFQYGMGQMKPTAAPVTSAPSGIPSSVYSWKGF